MACEWLCIYMRNDNDDNDAFDAFTYKLIVA